MTRRVLIIGGTKFIGKKLVSRLVENNDDVFVFSRSRYEGSEEKSITSLLGDRDTQSGYKLLKDSIDQLDFDCVYDMCCYNKSQADRLLQIVKNKAKHIIFFSSAAVYEPSEIFPLNEDSPKGEHPSFGNYGANKLAAEKSYISWSQDTGNRLTIFRPHYILGKGDYFKRHNYVFSQLQDNGEVEIPGNGQALIQFAYSEDVVDAFFKVPLLQEQVVEILNISSNEIITLNGFVKKLAAFIDMKTRLINVDMSKKNKDEKHFYDDGFPFPNLNLVISDLKLQQKYDISHTKIDDYVHELYDDWRSQNK